LIFSFSIGSHFIKILKPILCRQKEFVYSLKFPTS